MLSTNPVCIYLSIIAVSISCISDVANKFANTTRHNFSNVNYTSAGGMWLVFENRFDNVHVRMIINFPRVAFAFIIHGPVLFQPWQVKQMPT